MNTEELGRNVDLCVLKYQEAYGRVPDAVIVPDNTMHALRDNRMLRNSGKERLPYSGMAVATAYGEVGAYWMSRFGERIEVKARTEARTYHKAGGIYPFILATKRWFPILRGLQGLDRFKDALDCDIGVPLKQLEAALVKRVSEIKKR